MLRSSVIGSRTFEPHEDAMPQSKDYRVSKKKRKDRRYTGHSRKVIAASNARARAISGDDKDPPAPAYRSQDDVYFDRIARIPQTDTSKAVQQELF